MSIALLASAGKGAAPILDASDVFSTYLYTGNSSTQTINNGIDLAGKGGLVWSKFRSGTASSGAHELVSDPTSGYLVTNKANGIDASTSVTGFTSTGYSLNNLSGWINESGRNYVSWTFRKAPKFFDIVTYTGDGVNPRMTPHSLGGVPGMVVIKALNTGGDWFVSHRSLATTNTYLTLNTSNATATFNSIGTHTATEFSTAGSNSNMTTYVAYLYAHDTSADGIIQCGSFITGTSNGNFSVTLGWEPQYVLYKEASTTGNWEVADIMRGGFDMQGVAGNQATNSLRPNLSNAEAGVDYIGPNATGFSGITSTNSTTYIYMAIRRPNKVPTSGTEVYKAIARIGTSATATVTGVGFAPDLVVVKSRDLAAPREFSWQDKLRGLTAQLASNSTNGEASYNSSSSITSFDMDGVSLGASAMVNNSAEKYSNHFFKRAKGFFDIVCYTGTGVARTVNHNLGVVPELMIVKSRSLTSGGTWFVYASPLGNTKWLSINGTGAEQVSSVAWDNTTPSSTTFRVGATTALTANNETFIAYLFTTLAGISKVGSYTGNGTSINLDMGFTSGCRFFMVKRTDSTGDWYIFDTVRGIVSANDPHLSLNTTAAEVTTDDSVDPYSLGLTVNQVAATNINVSSATYIYLAIA